MHIGLCSCLIEVLFERFVEVQLKNRWGGGWFRNCRSRGPTGLALKTTGVNNISLFSVRTLGFSSGEKEAMGNVKQCISLKSQS